MAAPPGSAALFCLVLVGCVSTGSGSLPDPQFTRLGDAVLDRDRQQVLTCDTDSTLQSLALDDGRKLWSRRDGLRPLLVDEDLIYGWRRLDDETERRSGARSRVRLAAVRARDGSDSDFLSDPVDLPIEPGLVHFDASIEHDRLELTWRERPRSQGGAELRRPLGRASLAAGRYVFDLETGKRRKTEPAQEPDGHGDQILESLPYWLGDTWDSQPLIVGRIPMVLRQELASGSSRLELVPADSKSRSEKIVLGDFEEPWLRVSPERSYLFVSDARDASGEPERSTLVFSLVEQKVLATVSLPEGSEVSTVAGDFVVSIVATPLGARPTGREDSTPAVAATSTRSLVVQRLATGDEIWRRPMSGPIQFPPPP